MIRVSIYQSGFNRHRVKSTVEPAVKAPWQTPHLIAANRETAEVTGIYYMLDALDEKAKEILNN